MLHAPINVFAFTEVWILSNLYICLACRIRHSVRIVLRVCSGQTVKCSSPFSLPSPAIFGLGERHSFGEEDNLQENLSPRFCFHKNVFIYTTWNNSIWEDWQETILDFFFACGNALMRCYVFLFPSTKFRKKYNPAKKHRLYLVFGPISSWVFSGSKFRFHCARWFFNRFQFHFLSAEIQPVHFLFPRVLDIC